MIDQQIADVGDDCDVLWRWWVAAAVVRKGGDVGLLWRRGGNRFGELAGVANR